jgi:hypothetical protein
MRHLPPHAAEQGGAFSRRQAYAAGFSAKQIRQRVSSGDWILLGPDVYRGAGQALTRRGLLVAATLSSQAALSHWSAASLHGMEVPASRRHPVGAPHITTSRPLHVNVPGLVEHRLRLSAEDLIVVDGLAVTTVLRTTLDLLAGLDRSDGLTLLFRAVQQGWLDRDALLSGIRRRAGWHGTPRLREYHAVLATGAHAMSERKLHSLLDEAGIPYDANVRIVLTNGRVAVVDVLIRGTRIVVEIDGREFHSSAERFQDDRRRQNALVNDGYTVLRFTWLDLIERPGYVIGVIRQQLAAAA